MDRKTLVIHHQDCPDSIVYVLDFSYPRNTVIELWKNHSLTLLDYHKTAQESLTGLPGCLADLQERRGTVVATLPPRPENAGPAGLRPGQGPLEVRTAPTAGKSAPTFTPRATTFKHGPKCTAFWKPTRKGPRQLK